MVSVMEKALIPAGYKQTEVGVIPEDWEVKPLGELVSTVEYGSSAKSNETGVMPVLRMGNLQSGKIDWNGLVYTSDLAEIAKYRLNKNDVLFNRTNTVDLVGKTSIYKAEHPAVFAGYLIRINRIETLLDADYLNYVLNSHHSKIYSKLVLSVAVSQANINGQKLKTYPIPTPPTKKEQTAIANALSDVDSLIAALEKLINKKSAIKTAAMQQLLTGKKRLPPFDQLNTGYKQTELGEIPGDWEIKNLESYCASFKTGKLDANAMTPDGEYRFYTCAKNFYWIDRFAFDTEALLVSGNGANVGYVHYYNGRFNAYQRTYVLSDFSADILYLKVYLEQKLADRIRVEVNSGNTPYITMDTLTEMCILIPKDKAEQTAIAGVLSDMDKDLEALQQRLHKTQQIKQGMMQVLLTGKIRLINGEKHG